MKPWKKVGSDRVTAVGFRTIVTKRFERNDGTLVTADTVHPIGSANVCAVALTSDNKVIISRQFRCGPEEIFDELPGGGVDKDESLEAAIRRELREETGYLPGSLQYLGRHYRDAWSNSVSHVFVARDCVLSEVGRNLDSFEEIEVALISISELYENAFSAKMSDPVAVLYAKEILDTL